MKYICSLITVSDINRSREFYEKVLGQKLKYDFGESITFQGDFSIHLQSHYKKLIDNKDVTLGGNNFELYFEYDNVDEVVKLLHENEVLFVHEVREQPWRQKVVRFYDPDRNIIEVGESLEYLAFRLRNEGLTVDKIAKITNMSMDFVMESIEKYK